MNCTACGAGLGAEQSYCIACGTRATPLGMPFVQVAQPGAEPAGQKRAPGSGRFVLPVPPQMATTFGAMAIGFGFVIGNAISPGIRAISAAAPPIAAAPAPAPAPVTPTVIDTGGAGGGGGAGRSDSSAIVAPSGDTSSSGGGGGGGNGGHHKKKKKKKGVSTLVGTVVHTNPGAGSYAVAAGGTLQAVHAADLPTAGDQIKVTVHKLHNGTFAQNGKRTPRGSQPQATFSGAVTYREDSATARVYTVSSRGSSVLVHGPPPGAGEIPQVGSAVTVSVAIGALGALAAPVPVVPPSTTPPITTQPTATQPASTCDTDGPTVPATPPPASVSALTQTAVTVDVPHGDTAEIEAIVQAVCAPTGKLALSADDLRESFSDMPELTLPSTIDASHLAPGQSINVTVSISPAPDNLFTVTGLSNDQGKAGADDQAQAQGTQK